MVVELVGVLQVLYLICSTLPHTYKVMTQHKQEKGIKLQSLSCNELVWLAMLSALPTKSAPPHFAKAAQSHSSCGCLLASSLALRLTGVADFSLGCCNLCTMDTLYILSLCVALNWAGISGCPFLCSCSVSVLIGFKVCMEASWLTAWLNHSCTLMALL